MTDPRRAGFTAIELLVVLIVFIALVGLSVPGMLGALRRGAVIDAGGAVQRISSQARQFARTRFDATRFYGVVLVDDGNGPAYAAVTYGTAATRDDILMSDGRPAIRQEFSRNVTAFRTGRPLAGTVGWMFQYRTGYPIALPSLSADPVAVTGLELRTIDGRYRAGLAVYSVGLISAQDQ